MKKLIILFLLLGVIFLSGLIWWKKGISAKDPRNTQTFLFVIPPKSSVREISNSLKREDLINDPVVFFLLVKKLGLDGKIQAGDFRLSQSMNAYDIATTLTHGTLDIWITVPEGKRAGEIADILKEKIPSFDEPWKNTLFQNEGYLFPDTYLVPKDASIELIVSQMKANFEEKFAQLDTSNTRLSKQDIVTIASLIEREAKFANDRPLVASVIVNRLQLGMPLQIDATIQYALGYQKDEKMWWKKNLTNDDLKLNSLYNTYLHQGLPPTPISNPGLEVLKAVVNPAKTNYLYYISDKNGKNHYAKTLEEHNENIKKYGL